MTTPPATSETPTLPVQPGAAAGNPPAGAPTGVPAPGGPRAAGKRPKTGPKPYDFRRPTKLSREHIRTLQIAFETYARQTTTLLTTSLRVVSTMSLISIEQQTYDEYISSLPGPSVIARMTMDPLPGTALLEFSLAAAMASIDHLLGGAGGEQPNRPLTDIETPLLRGLLERTLAELRYAFEPVATIQPTLGGLEYNPQFAQACAPADPVIVASFEMKIGAEECVATICIPLATVFPRLQQRGATAVSDRQRADRENAHRRMIAGLQSAPIDVAVRFAAVRMRAVDIIDLRPGDVVPLGHPVTAPLAVTAAGVTFAHAVPGNQGTRLACLVVPPPKENHA